MRVETYPVPGLLGGDRGVLLGALDHEQVVRDGSLDGRTEMRGLERDRSDLPLRLPPVTHSRYLRSERKHVDEELVKARLSRDQRLE